jgi:thioredoxin
VAFGVCGYGKSDRINKRIVLGFVWWYQFAVIHFWAVWSRYDLQMTRIIKEDIPHDLRNRVVFPRFNVDQVEHHEICRQHRVLNVPLLALYRNGSLVDSITGLAPLSEVIRKLRELVGT